MIQVMSSVANYRVRKVTGLTDFAMNLIKDFSSERAKEKKEACGIFLGDNVYPTALLELSNRSPESNNFWIDKNDIAPFLGKVRLIWHSHYKDEHPGCLTYPDILLAHKMQLPIFMYHAASGEIDYYQPNNPNPYPLYRDWDLGTNIENYLGWQCNQWGWGRTDCFAVVRSYFLGVHDIDIGNFERPDWYGFPQPEWKTPWEAEDNGFHLVENIKNYDIIEMALNGGSNANHLAVVVDAQRELILHQPGFGYLSKIDKFGSYWRSRIAIDTKTKRYRILRHKNFISGHDD